MRRIEPRGSWNVFRLVVLAQFSLPLLNIVCFQFSGGHLAGVVFVHQLLISLGYLALFAVATAPACLHLVRARRAARYALPFAWGGFTMLLYFVYLLAWGGRRIGMHLTPALVLPYVLHPSWVLDTLPISPWLFWGVLLAVPLVLLAAYLTAARSFGAVLLRLHIRLRRLRRTRPATFHRGVLAASLPVLLIVFVLDFGPRTTRFFGDPIFLALSAEENVGSGGNLRVVDAPGPHDGSGQQGVMPIFTSSAASEMARRAYVVPAAFQKKNVVLIVIDACRADHLGVLGYTRDDTPFLDSLQRGGHLRAVRTFSSASCCTYGGVMSLLRSQNWFRMSHRGFALQDVLKKAGYRVHFVLNGDLSCFEAMKSFDGKSIDTISDGFSPERHFGLNDDRGVLESCEKLPAADGTPAFLYFHLMSVHPLGPRQPEYLRYWPTGFHFDPQRYGNNYDNGVLQADDNIRKIFSMLKAKGYLQNAIAVITGDHGESIGERGVYSHLRNLYAEEVSPPLLIYDPEPVAYRNLDFARQIDVAPTILDRLGLPIPSSWDGHSLLSDEPPRFSYLSLANYYAVIDHTTTQTLKYIFDDRAKTEEVYDESSDPHDLRNIIGQIDPVELGELRTAIEAFSVHPGPSVDKDDLRSPQNVSGSTPVSPSSPPASARGR